MDSASQPVAFFDIDGTVFRSSLLIELIKMLINEDVFPASAREKYTEAREAWENREGSYEDYITAVVDTYMRHIKGVHYGDLAELGQLVVAKHQKRVYRYTRDLIKELKNDGYYIVAISQSPKTILDTFCMGYGFDKVYGRFYEIGPQDRFTGEVGEAHLIENKASIVHRVVEKEGVTLKNSVGVGDTESDISLLEAVDRPICFNPNKQLFVHATRQGWPIVVERKDVIYEL